MELEEHMDFKIILLLMFVVLSDYQLYFVGVAASINY
jgi:hypothetical protein